jgi:hypothetical protein
MSFYGTIPNDSIETMFKPSGIEQKGKVKFLQFYKAPCLSQNILSMVNAKQNRFTEIPGF